jgi:hypothetical protein
MSAIETRMALKNEKTKNVFSWDEKDTQCCICLDVFGEIGTSPTFMPIKLGPCNHIVCVNCLPRMNGDKCPMCRAKIQEKKVLQDFLDISKEGKEAWEAYKHVVRFAKNSKKEEKRRREGLPPRMVKK